VADHHIPILRLPYSEADIAYITSEIADVLRSGYLTMADRVREFETLFAEFCGTKYAIGTSSGTSSIEVLLRCIGVEGRTVVMPSNTYMATPLAAIKAGARVIFADCEWDNLQMCPDDLRRQIQDDTAAVILVHIGGIISPRFDEIKAICEEKAIPLIEDAAHAHGASRCGARAGSLALGGSFSFYPTKVLTTAEGGMVTTDDKALYDKALILREHGKADHGVNVHVEIGDNWRFSEIHAVLGIQQMRKADQIVGVRRRLAAQYDQLLSDDSGLQRLDLRNCGEPAYYKYVAYLPSGADRATIKRRLREDFDIAMPGEVYSDPCHSQPVFERYPNTCANPSARFPVTDRVCERQICLPLYPGLTDEEQDYVVESIRTVLR
jgi:perosamine synthetase